VDERYVRRYKELYERHWWWRAREDLLLETVPRIAPARRPLEILDVGCGDGLFFEKLSRFGRVCGLETDPAAVTPGAVWEDRIHVGAFDGSYQPGRAFDLVLLLDVLEHLTEPVAALTRARALLAPEGRILVTVPAFRSLWTRHDDLNRHRTRYRRATLRRESEAAGLSVLEMRYFFAWVAPVKVLQRGMEWLWPAAPSPPSIPGGAVNAMLYRASRAEQWLLAARSAPFGSSLLAVLGDAAPGAPETSPNPVP
jgi:2-polyprenyl-3-methyl-5-hydroxy-6-metoxy-1,4-benzoquinol methylase